MIWFVSSSIIPGAAADSWLAFMDRLLTLGDECDVEKQTLKEKMHKLINIFYDALDAPKSGMKVSWSAFVFSHAQYLKGWWDEWTSDICLRLGLGICFILLCSAVKWLSEHSGSDES